MTTEWRDGAKRYSGATLRIVIGMAIALLSVPPHVAADDCQAMLERFLLPSDPHLSSIQVTMVTLNDHDTASYAETRLYYLLPRKSRTGATTPGRFVTLAAGSQGIDQPKFDFGLTVQVFSDRILSGLPPTGTHVGLPHHGMQKFDERQADSLGFEITVEPTPHVTITLRSWSDAKTTFIPECDANFLTGRAQGVHYILRVKTWGER